MNINTQIQYAGFFLLALLLVCVIGYIDTITGYQLGFSLFYLIPIAALAWRTNLLYGIIIAVISMFVWAFVDEITRPTPLALFIVSWNAAIRLGFFVIIVVLLCKLKTSLEKERLMARTDSLTQAANSQAFLEALLFERSRSQRYQRPLTLVYMDCDNFKAVNDTHGHYKGDLLLKTIVTTIKQSLRPTDIAARLGGDEFAILLPETDKDQAKIAITRLQSQLMDNMSKQNWPVTFSIGVITFHTTMFSEEDMIKKADSLMYSAKKSGKNQTFYSTVNS